MAVYFDWAGRTLNFEPMAITLLDRNISDFIVENGFPCERIIFCRTPAFIIYRLGGRLVMNDTACELSKYAKRRVLTEKSMFPNPSANHKECELTSHPHATFTRSFKDIAELRRYMRQGKGIYVVFSHDEFLRDLNAGTIRMAVISEI